MKKLFLFIITIACVVYGYGEFINNPDHISNPVYLESGVVVEIPKISRELEYIFLGEMVSQDDCKKREGYFLKQLFENCKECEIKSTICKASVHQRYSKLFLGHKTHTTHLSFKKGNRFERNGRMVIWGLTDKEAGYACKEIKNKVKDKYKGEVQCVAGK